MNEKYSYYVCLQFTKNSGEIGYMSNIIDSISKLNKQLIFDICEDCKERFDLKDCVLLNIIKLDND